MKCFVPSCGIDFHFLENYSGHSSNEKASEHRFPKNVEQRRKWLQAIADAEQLNVDMNSINFKSVRICSNHFEEHCFYKISARKRLTKFAIPTIFLPYFLTQQK